MGSVKMFYKLGLCTVFFISISLVCGVCDVSAKAKKKGVKERTRVIELWSEGKPAFGVFVADKTKAGAESLAKRDLDFVFLDWEHGGYDIEALKAFAAGLDSGDREISFVVRIPPIGKNIENVAPIGLDMAKQYVAEILSVEGVDGVVFPFISGADEARQAVSCFTESGADVWSPQNPRGTVISWLMIENTEALTEVREIANTPGISVLVTGTGTLSGEVVGPEGAVLGPKGAEIGKQLVLAHTTRVGIPNVSMALFSADAVIEQLNQGFPGILVVGRDDDAVDEWIQGGRKYFEEEKK